MCVCVCVCTSCAQSLRRVHLFAIPWTACPPSSSSMEFSRQEYWSGLPFPPPGDLPRPEIELKSLASPTLAGRFFTTSATWEALWQIFRLFSIRNYYKILTIVPCAIQQVLVSYFIYSTVYLFIPSFSFIPPFPFGNHKFVSYVYKSISAL